MAWGRLAPADCILMKPRKADETLKLTLKSLSNFTQIQKYPETRGGENRLCKSSPARSRFEMQKSRTVGNGETRSYAIYLAENL